MPFGSNNSSNEGDNCSQELNNTTSSSRSNEALKCKNDCGFYGSTQFYGFCSLCYAKFQQDIDNNNNNINSNNNINNINTNNSNNNNNSNNTTKTSDIMISQLQLGDDNESLIMASDHDLNIDQIISDTTSRGGSGSGLLTDTQYNSINCRNDDATSQMDELSEIAINQILRSNESSNIKRNENNNDNNNGNSTAISNRDVQNDGYLDGDEKIFEAQASRKNDDYSIDASVDIGQTIKNSEISEKVLLKNREIGKNEKKDIIDSEVKENLPKKQEQLDKTKCATCSKKLKITDFECRCGLKLCRAHRLSQKHNCTFDFLAMQRQQIESKYLSSRPKNIKEF